MVTLSDLLLLDLSVSSATVYLAIAAVVAVIYYRLQASFENEWYRYSVKSPRLPRGIITGQDFKARIIELFRQYGDTVGIQEGSNLTLLTANLDLWRQILIKDFGNFVDREIPPLSSHPFFKSLFFAPGAEWRRFRQILSPTFTSGKLKNISKSVAKSAQDLTEYLVKSAKSGSLVEMKDTCGRYTSEIIAKTAFGLNASFIGDGEAEFYHYSRNMFNFKDRTGLGGIVQNLLQKIPYLKFLSVKVFKMQYFEPVNFEANKYFEAVLKNTTEEKRQQQAKGVDKSQKCFLDLLLDANEAAAAGKLEVTEETFQGQNDSTKVLQKMTEEDILGQSMLVIFAGMETTATTLQNCLYELAGNPDIQEKVFQEITKVVKNEIPTPEEINQLTYTEQVLNETLRLYPPAPTVNRIAKETRTYNGVTIPKGASVTIPYFYVMKDPNIFPEPEKFDPDRFSSEEKEKRDPIAFSPFGQGPRICLGMRLAYLELKEGLVHILRKLRVVLHENTEPKKGTGRIAFTEHRLVIPIKPIKLAFELRDVDEK